MNPTRRGVNPRAVGGMLTHFTRASHPSAAIDNLVGILTAGVIRASTRMIRTRRPVVCFFDAPFEHLARVLDRTSRRRYEPFGIAVNKRYAFEMGARPLSTCPGTKRSRCCRAPNYGGWSVWIWSRQPAIDWTFEREWRMAGDLGLAAAETVVLVEDWRDADEIYERFDGHPPCAGVLPLKSLFPPKP